MSLVDYASSSSDSDDDVDVDVDVSEKAKTEVEFGPVMDPSLRQYPKPVSPPRQQPECGLNLPAPSFDKLPDASFLLNSSAMPSHLVSANDHSSRVAAAMAESESRKRNSKGSSSSYLRSKVPRGTLSHSRNIPDTLGGALVPPQLRGRSNIVTEDIGKLFAKKHAGTSSG